ncbi:MAG: hypothetical protein ACREQP_03750, partial [Candidatus Binatia bacterium]
LDAWTAEWQSLLLPYLPELPALVSELRDAASQLERAALEASEGFDWIRVQACAALGGRSRELEQEIVRVMVALQFQDIVNQKITHAIDTLTRLDADLDKSLGRPVSEGRPKRRVNGVSYPMLKHTPKETGRHLPYGRNSAVKGSEIEPSGDIEIFLPEVNS